MSESATPSEDEAVHAGLPVVKSRERKRPAPEVVARAVSADVPPLPKRREPSAIEESPVPPEPMPKADASVSAPVDEKLEVAVAPKYDGPYEENRVVDALPNVARPVCTDVPLTVNEPMVA